MRTKLDKPQYELSPLRAAIIQCKTNIVAFEEAIAKEQNKITELEGYIKQWEEYSKLEGEVD